MALKLVDDVNGNKFDDELSSTKIAYLGKNFRNFLRNNNKRARGKNNAEPRNFKRNESTKVNNTDKFKERVSQTSNNSMGQQYFGCQWYGHVKSKYHIFLRSKSKVIVVTFSDDEVSNHESGSDEEVSYHESGSDEDGNFITFTATTIVDESVVVNKNPFNGELSENADLQEAYNKLCKIATKDAMNVDIGLKKIASFELGKKNLLLKLFNANELINKVKTENM